MNWKSEHIIEYLVQSSWALFLHLCWAVERGGVYARCQKINTIECVIYAINILTIQWFSVYVLSNMAICHFYPLTYSAVALYWVYFWTRHSYLDLTACQIVGIWFGRLLLTATANKMYFYSFSEVFLRTMLHIHTPFIQ